MNFSNDWFRNNSAAIRRFIYSTHMSLTSGCSCLRKQARKSLCITEGYVLTRGNDEFKTEGWVRRMDFWVWNSPATDVCAIPNNLKLSRVGPFLCFLEDIMPKFLLKVVARKANWDTWSVLKSPYFTSILSFGKTWNSKNFCKDYRLQICFGEDCSSNTVLLCLFYF